MALAGTVSIFATHLGGLEGVTAVVVAFPLSMRSLLWCMFVMALFVSLCAFCERSDVRVRVCAPQLPETVKGLYVYHVSGNADASAALPVACRTRCIRGPLLISVCVLLISTPAKSYCIAGNDSND